MQNGDASDNKELEGGPGESVARTLIDSLTTSMRIAGYSSVADEPRSAGGHALGPSPYDLLAAALASCTSMTLSMYATRKALPLASATVRVRHRRMHAKDCEDCMSGDARIDEFQREIALEGELDDAQRQRLLEIADKCPVHRTLQGEIKVRTRLAT
jgi:uncharacterized OsmC-like protein